MEVSILCKVDKLSHFHLERLLLYCVCLARRDRIVSEKEKQFHKLLSWRRMHRTVVNGVVYHSFEVSLRINWVHSKKNNGPIPSLQRQTYHHQRDGCQNRDTAIKQSQILASSEMPELMLLLLQNSVALTYTCGDHWVLHMCYTTKTHAIHFSNNGSVS